MTDAEQLEVLRAYAAGRLGTRQTIERAGLADYADLIVSDAPPVISIRLSRLRDRVLG